MPGTDVDGTRARRLIAHLAESDEQCPSCCYELRGLKSDRCPECNQALMLRVALVEARLAAFFATMIAAASGFGFSVLLLLFALIAPILKGRGNVPGLVPVITGIGALVNGVFLLLLLWKRRAFCRAGAFFRWSCFVLAAVCNLVLLVVFTLLVR